MIIESYEKIQYWSQLGLSMFHNLCFSVIAIFGSTASFATMFHFSCMVVIVTFLSVDLSGFLGS